MIIIQSVQAEDSASSVICSFVVIYLFIILFVQVNADVDFSPHTSVVGSKISK
jgi:hypothetical protein